MEPWNNGAEIIGSITSRAPSESQWKRSFHLSAQGIKSQSRQRPVHSYPFVSKPRAITARNCDRAKPGNLETIFPSFPPRAVPKLKYSADVGNESSKTDRIKREGENYRGETSHFHALHPSPNERERGRERENPGKNLSYPQSSIDLKQNSHFWGPRIERSAQLPRAVPRRCRPNRRPTASVCERRRSLACR